MNIKMEQVDMVYKNGKKALTDVSLTLENTGMVGLLGKNGAGKTTLMKLLVAQELQTAGEIKVDGIPLISKEKEFKSNLGYLPQHFGLYDELSIYQFLDYMCSLKGITKSAKEEISKVLKATNLEHIPKQRIKTLSGGQRQRVGIAQALLGNPKILIFDEPTVGLDPEERISFRNLFSKFASDKIVLLSTHIIEDIQSVCDYLIVLHNGKIVFQGTPESLIAIAQGHVGTILEKDMTENLHITSRLNSANGIILRVVGENMPNDVTIVEPSLEDAYLYLTTCKEDI